MRSPVPQTRHGRAVAATGVLVLSWSVGCTPGGEKATPTPFAIAGGLPAARLAPVVVIPARLPQRVPVAFTNPTADELTYAIDADGTGLYQLGGSLHRDGQLVREARIMYEHPPFQMTQVRRLKPGAAVALHYELPYVKVKPGRYELRLTYEVYPESVDVTKHGLTAMKLEQTIILDVLDE